jgi:hypothetical protein
VSDCRIIAVISFHFYGTNSIERQNLHNTRKRCFLEVKLYSLCSWEKVKREWKQLKGVWAIFVSFCYTKMRCQRVINHISWLQWPFLESKQYEISKRSLWERRCFHNEIKRNDIYRNLNRQNFYWSHVEDESAEKHWKSSSCYE